MNGAAEEPESIFRAFEEATRMTVCFHDYSGRLYGYVAPERIGHESVHCAAVKARHMNTCVVCETTFLRACLLRRPEGFAKLCHAGLVDWAVPSMRNGQLEWIAFAGQRAPGPRLEGVPRQPGPRTPEPWMPAMRPRPVHQAEVNRVLELLRMLVARVRAWREELDRTHAPLPGARPAQEIGAEASRAYEIRSFLAERHKQPVKLADLAKRLHLSPSRTGHAVRECCGASFVELLAAERMRTAAGLLLRSSLSVREVARRSGYRDLSAFHAAFRRAHRLTPLAYRKRRSGGKI